MTTRVITKALAVEQDLKLGKGNVQQSRGGSTLELQSISISKVITDVSIFANNTTALDSSVSEYVDPTLHSTVLVEGYNTQGDEGGGIFYFDVSAAPAGVDGGHIFASGVVTVLGAWIRFTDDKIINVKHFGATGDGVTDDTAALLLAIAAVNTRTKAVLYFPEGIYNVTGSLNMTAADMVVVRGDGMQNTIINHTGSSGPLFLFDTGAEVDEAAQFGMMMDLTLRTDQINLTAIDLTSTALVTDITRSFYITRVLFIGLTSADGWKFAIHSKDVRGITVKDVYARHVSPGPNVGTIFWNIDNILAFGADTYTSFNNETHFYENDFGATIPTGGGAGAAVDGANIIDDTITIAKFADATPGDIIIWDASGEAVLLTIGASGFVLTSNGAGLPPSWQVVTASVEIGEGLSGLILSNDTDTDHDINITAGAATDSTDTKNLILGSEITKQIDAAFVAGDDVGGLFTGAVAPDTTYHIFIIKKDSDDSIDVGFDTSVIAANIPAGFTEFRRIGSVVTDSSSNIINGTWLENGTFFLLKTPITDVNTAALGTTASTFTLSSPTDLKLQVFMNGVVADTANDAAVYISSLDSDDQAASGGISTLQDDNVAAGGISQLHVFTNTSSQIRARSSDTPDTFILTLLGWRDTRGK